MSEHWTSAYTAEFGRQIAERRTRRGWNRDDLAVASAVKRSYLTSIEDGHHGPSLATAYRLAHALGVDLPLLLIDVQAALDDQQAQARKGAA